MDKHAYQSISDAEQLLVHDARARAGSDLSSSRGRGHHRSSNKSKGSNTSSLLSQMQRKKQQQRPIRLKGLAATEEVEEVSIDDIFGSCFSSTVFESPYFYGPLVVFVSLVAGIFVYRFNNGWPWTMCFYYAAQALVGEITQTIFSPFNIANILSLMVLKLPSVRCLKCRSKVVKNLTLSFASMYNLVSSPKWN